MQSIAYNERIRAKVAALPDGPGCYIMRDRRGKIIYVGKAASLRRRVGGYFRPATFRHADPKLRGLLRSVEDLDILPLESEAQALLTESRLIHDYRPRYNVLLKDDKRFLLLKMRPSDPFPRFEAVRLRKDDGAQYWGPYASTAVARASLDFLARHFGCRRCAERVPDAETHRHCHDDVVARCLAPCIGKCTPEAYHAAVDEAAAFLDGDRPEALAPLREAMGAAAAERKFEHAAALRDLLMLLERTRRDRAAVPRTPAMAAADREEGLASLARALDLPGPPRRIECYDISHISGTHAVASRVVAVDGVPAPALYRRFRIRTAEGGDDPASIAEVVKRRFAGTLAGEEPPELLLVDGGATQTRAAREALAGTAGEGTALAGLAKRYETLVREDGSEIRFPEDSPALQIVRRLRDESHRFAITYHRSLRAKVIRESVLDDVPGIGPAKKKALLRHFGSLAAMRQASEEELAAAPGMTAGLAEALRAALVRRR